jgi:hypothetical protein
MPRHVLTTAECRRGWEGLCRAARGHAVSRRARQAQWVLERLAAGWASSRAERRRQLAYDGQAARGAAAHRCRHARA